MDSNPLKSAWKKPHRILPYIKRQYRIGERWLAHSTGIVLHKNEKKLQALHNRYLGERCFIVGNGPSLTWADLDKLIPEYSFASNKIYLSYEFTQFRPSFYTVIDSYVFDNNREEIDQIQSMKLFPSFFEELLRGADAIFFRTGGPNLGGFGTEPVFGKHFYGGYSVIFTQLQLAWYMGFRKLYLIGMDHTWHLPAGEEPENDGYYQVLVGGREVNHFHPGYRKPGEKWTLPQPKEQEIAYRHAKSFIEANGGVIQNATRSGKLEVFDRVDFDSLFEV
jgi:hypothetical protein